MIKKTMTYLILIILVALLIFLSIEKTESNKKLWVLGSNLGTWGVKEPGEIDEPFVLNPVQRQLAMGVIGTLRFGTSCEGYGCANNLIPDSMLLDLLDKIEEIDAEPLCVLSLINDTQAKHIVELFEGRVKYYELGNEPDLVYGTAEDYVDRWNSIVPQLKAVDPNIKIGGPVISGYSELGQNYIRIFLESSNPKPDFVSWHMYAGRGNDSDSKIINIASKWGDYIDDVENNVIIPTVGYSLPIVISEWNWNAVPEYDKDYRDEDETFIWNFTSTVIEEFRNSKNVLMTHQYCYGAHCANGHLAMLGGEWAYSDPKPQYNVFLYYSRIICPECQRK